VRGENGELFDPVYVSGRCPGRSEELGQLSVPLPATLDPPAPPADVADEIVDDVGVPALSPSATRSECASHAVIHNTATNHSAVFDTLTFHDNIMTNSIARPRAIDHCQRSKNYNHDQLFALYCWDVPRPERRIPRLSAPCSDCSGRCSGCCSAPPPAPARQTLASLHPPRPRRCHLHPQPLHPPAMRWLSRLKQWFARRPSRAEKQLLHRCRGDADQSERLIGHELARRPQLSRAAASQAALDRWSRDR